MKFASKYCVGAEFEPGNGHRERGRPRVKWVRVVSDAHISASPRSICITQVSGCNNSNRRSRTRVKLTPETRKRRTRRNRMFTWFHSILMPPPPMPSDELPINEEVQSRGGAYLDLITFQDLIIFRSAIKVFTTFFNSGPKNDTSLWLIWFN